MNIKNAIAIFLLVILSLFSVQLSADSWKDPTWKEMIDSADVIALIVYTSKGKFKSKAKPITIYKGQMNAEEIWISGFSNRYGPIDSVDAGDKYIVFLKLQNPNSGPGYWVKKPKEDQQQIEYKEAIKSSRAYYVPTPTSGDLRVKGNKVQYNLLQPIFGKQQSFYDLKEFELFLEATKTKSNKNFHEKTLRKVKSNVANKRCAQYLMMLYLTSFKTFDPIYQTIADYKNEQSSYALTQILSAIEGKHSSDILIQLLDHESLVVQHEAIEHLLSLEDESIGATLLKKLNSAGKERNH